VVDEGVTGGVFATLADMVAGLPRIMELDRAAVRAKAVQKFGVARMVDEYVAAYRHILRAFSDRAVR
jgi:hypothetical protein